VQAALTVNSQLFLGLRTDLCRRIQQANGSERNEGDNNTLGLSLGRETYYCIPLGVLKVRGYPLSEP